MNIKIGYGLPSKLEQRIMRGNEPGGIASDGPPHDPPHGLSPHPAVCLPLVKGLRKAPDFVAICVDTLKAGRYSAGAVMTGRTAAFNCAPDFRAMKPIIRKGAFTMFRKTVVALAVIGSVAAALSVADLRAQQASRSRADVYKDIEATLGLVPSMFKVIPDASLDLEWQLFKQVQLAGGAIPNKYRELIGVAMSGVTKCRYCAYFHTQVAKLNGATDAEIEDAIHYAKSSAGWSTYINGMQLDYDQFCKEVDQVCAHVQAAQAKTTTGK